MVDFSVAIPTYNGAKRLPDVLDCLRSQTHLHALNWEVLVVDNHSNDDTAAVVEAYQSHWSADSSLRYLFEPERGAAFARQRAVEMAKGPYIGFLDDDNLPASNWVATAYEFARNHPQMGACGSAIRGDFPQPPPEALAALYSYLGIIDRGPIAHRYKLQDRVLPPTAGLVVRREAWLEAVPQRLFLNHTDKSAGLSCEDLEALLYIQKAGWEIWHNPALKVCHKIAPERWEKDYLLSAMRCNGLSRHHLRMLRLEPWQQPGATVAYWVKDFLQLLYHLGRHGALSKTDVVEACQRQLLRSMLLSPFFLGKIRWDNWRQRNNE